MRVSNLFAIKTFLCILLKTSAQCGFVIMCFITCLQFLTGRKAAFYRCRSDGELVGSVAAFSGNTLPSGWLLCDGSAVSRETYAALFNIIGTTYGTGDGGITFNLPNLSNKFIEGSTTAGTEKSAGLPNITGGFLWREAVGEPSPLDTFKGAFSGGSYTGENVGTLMAESGISGYRRKNADFNASASNSIYGNSTTVQPPALTMRYAIYSGVVNKKLWLRTI